MMKRALTLPIMICGLSGVIGSCRAQEQPAAPADTAAAAETAPALAAGVRTQLDSANAAFRAKNYDAARTYYRKVTEIDPALSAGWFGVYMAELKLGNQAAADSAIARARKEGGS